MTAHLLLTLVLAPPAQKAAAPVTRAKALELYTATCQVCHGPDGRGAPLTKDLGFAGRKWKHGSRLQDVVATITNGVPATPMLPFKGRLTPADIAALAQLVRSYDKSLKLAPPKGRLPRRSARPAPDLARQGACAEAG